MKLGELERKSKICMTWTEKPYLEKILEMVKEF